MEREIERERARAKADEGRWRRPYPGVGDRAVRDAGGAQHAAALGGEEVTRAGPVSGGCG